jgi:Fe-S cluster biogenesis protein NfuA
VWLKFEEDVVFRTDNPAWLEAMERFTTEVAKVVEPYLARNGGPIIMAQIENEYGE